MAILILILSLFVLLGILANRYGYDSRERLESNEEQWRRMGSASMRCRPMKSWQRSLSWHASGAARHPLPRWSWRAPLPHFPRPFGAEDPSCQGTRNVSMAIQL